MSNTTTTQNISMGMTQGIGMTNTSKIKKYNQVNRLCRVKGLNGDMTDMILDTIAHGANVRDSAQHPSGVSMHEKVFLLEIKTCGWFHILKDYSGWNHIVAVIYNLASSTHEYTENRENAEFYNLLQAMTSHYANINYRRKR